MNDLRVLRDRQTAAADRLDTVGDSDDPHGSAALFAITTTFSSYPITPTAYYALHPQIITGVETEGGSPTVTPDLGTFIYALNLGTQIPPVNTQIVIHSAGGRWVFRYDG
jgi:hypothetical protein